MLELSLKFFQTELILGLIELKILKQGESTDGNYQLSRAKTAIVSGKLLGLGAGKSRMKNFLPQSSSDFIYAIIVEEFGLIGGVH